MDKIIKEVLQNIRFESIEGTKEFLCLADMFLVKDVGSIYPMHEIFITLDEKGSNKNGIRIEVDKDNKVVTETTVSFDAAECGRVNSILDEMICNNAEGKQVKQALFLFYILYQTEWSDCFGWVFDDLSRHSDVEHNKIWEEIEDHNTLKARYLRYIDDWSEIVFCTTPKSILQQREEEYEAAKDTEEYYDLCPIERLTIKYPKAKKDFHFDEHERNALYAAIRSRNDEYNLNYTLIKNELTFYLENGTPTVNFIGDKLHAMKDFILHCMTNYMPRPHTNKRLGADRATIVDKYFKKVLTPINIYLNRHKNAIKYRYTPADVIRYLLLPGFSHFDKLCSNNYRIPNKLKDSEKILVWGSYCEYLCLTEKH